MLEALKKEVCEANLELVRRGLVFGTWGNASGFERADGLVVIKPSGVPYDEMQPEHMVVVDLEGNIEEGDLRPSSDTRTHIEIYKAFDQVHGVVHTHSHFATCWAQACRPIPCFGTTHADYFYGDVPLTDRMTEEEIRSDYERNTGRVIVRRFDDLDPMQYPGVLVANHGPFAWGGSPLKAVENAAVLEEIAHMAYDTVALASACPPIDRCLLDKHFLRKHGANAYYGQGKERV
jgi:L-ribulose-5-phosphate 4-epimerase